MLHLSSVTKAVVVSLGLAGFAIGAGSFIGTQALAAEIPMPGDPVILTVGGEIENTNDGDKARFDYAGLETLPRFTLNTTTPWTEGMQTFEGVLLRDLLSALGAKGSTIQAVALNDYAIEIPVSDGEEADVIVAYLQNGQRMSVRQKGPLWIIYPDSVSSPLATERMIWQLDRMTVLP